MSFHLPTSEKLALLHRVKLGEPIAKVCREAGISRTIFYRWQKTYASAGPRAKETALDSRYPRGTSHWRSLSGRIEWRLLSIISLHPDWSCERLAKELGRRLRRAISAHGVWKLLRKHGLTTADARMEWASRRRGRGVVELSPADRASMIEAVSVHGRPVAQVCHEFGISRTTFYKWYRLYRAGETEFASQRPAGERHWKTIPGVSSQILELVRRFPEYGSARLAKELTRVREGRPTLGNHGVYNILKRYRLSLYEQRLAYVRERATVLPVRPVTEWVGRIRQVFEQFLPGRAPAPPPLPRLRRAGPAFFKQLRRSSPFLLSAFLLLFGLFTWGRLLGSAESTGQGIGFFFASIALSMGTLFFLYSLKYYFTLAVVLSFSREADSTSSTSEVSTRKVPFWARLFGIGKISTSVSFTPEVKSADTSGVSFSAGGLEPDLTQVELERKPFISIHLPMYNEKRVAERILRACTSFDYPHFEIVVADDSTDETTEIVRRFAEEHNQRLASSGERLGGVPRIKVIHRDSREGFKGGALKEALKHTDSKAEFVVVFDADFVPYPDTLELFLKYFQVNAGGLDFKKKNKELRIRNQGERAHDSSFLLHDSCRVAAIQGYQWHVLNKSENWITRGVRSEYAGSYVIERSGEELYGGLKQIAGSVYMIRRDLLDRFGWGTSLTEDFELTLKLYEAGYKVVYTPYIQAPAECASTLKRLVRQRMRWAEGHSFNIKKRFLSLLQSPGLTRNEKLEFLYLSPYYLQAAFFLIGTVSWLISETVFAARLPFWTTVWGWSLVLTNMLSLPLMNTVGLFLEEAEERDFAGVLSFVALSYILVPFQAYASVKGFLESEEGPWFRTPKTGKITDVLMRGRFYRFISGIFPGRTRSQPSAIAQISTKYMSLATANNQFNSFGFKPKPKRMRWVGKALLVAVLVMSMTLVSFSPMIDDSIAQAGAQVPEIFSEKKDFKFDEDPEFTLFLKNPSSGVSTRPFIQRAIAAETKNIEASVYYQNEKVDVPVQVEKKPDGNVSLRLDQNVLHKPGKYELRATVDRGNQKMIAAQDFTWGVLAINTNKSIYLPGETAKLAFAVLNDEGEMVCDASLKLKVKSSKLKVNDELSTEDGSIRVNSGCNKKEMILEADYEAEYKVGGAGIYDTTLIAETQNGKYTINDSFEVRKSVAFDIERRAPTRIYPPETYPVRLSIKANEDFIGEVVESVPETFEIEESTDYRLRTTAVDSRQSTVDIIWQVDWRKGEVYELSYKFDAPDISPQFYLLGPLTLYPRKSAKNRRESAVFAEQRLWQVAVDSHTTGNLFPVGNGDNQPSTWADEVPNNCDTGGSNCWDSVEESSGSDTNCSPTTDGDSFYVKTDTTGASITFDINESSITAGSTITDMSIKVCLRTDEGGQNSQIQTIRCVGTTCTDFGTDSANVGGSYADITQNHTGLSITDLSDLGIGIKRTGGARAIRVTRILVDITYDTATDVTQTHYRWRNDDGGEGAGSIQVSAASDTTTTSSTDVLVTDMTITPGAGDYNIWFTGSMETDTTATTQHVSIYVAGSQEGHTERQIFNEGSLDVATSIPIATHARKISVGASDAIEVRWRTSGGTSTMHERTLVVSKITAANSTQDSATGNTTTSSTSDVVINTMTRTPGAGDYHIWFSASLENDGVDGLTPVDQFVSIYVGGTQEAHSERNILSEGSLANTSLPVATHARVTGVGASDAIEVRWRVSNGSSVSTMHERTLVIEKITASDSTQDISTTDTTTSSTTDTLINSMTRTPGAGDYHVFFSASLENDGSDVNSFVSLYVGGTKVPHTERQSFTENSIQDTSFHISTHLSVPNVGTSDAIEVKWRVSGGTATMHQRTLVVTKFSADGATFARDQDTKFDSPALDKNTIIRLRFELSNEGELDDAATTFQLQVAETATCSSGSYSAVPTDTSGDWQIVGSANITDGEATQNINPGLTDEEDTFEPGELKDTGNTTGSITIEGDEFTEIEFSIQALDAATNNGNYCFRLSNVDTYSVYAEAVVIPERLWLLFGLGPLLPLLLRRMKERLVLRQSSG